MTQNTCSLWNEATTLVSHLVRRADGVFPGLAPQRPPGTWRWYVLPIAALLTFSARSSYWPMRLRFALSKHAFEQKVRDIVDGKPSGSVPQRIGLYWVKRIHKLEENQIGFETGGEHHRSRGDHLQTVQSSIRSLPHADL